MKLIGKLLLLLIVIMGVILGAAHLWLGGLIKEAVERIGPKITQTSVTLDDVDISLLGGSAQLEKLVIGNPHGFKAPTSFKVRKAKVRLDWRSALSERVVIENLTIDAPEITIEGVLSKSNISVIQDNIRAYSPSVATKPDSGMKSDGKKEGIKKGYIQDLAIINGRVTVWLNGGSLVGKPVTVALADIHLKDLGKRSGGVTAQELSLAIVEAMNHEVSRAVANAGNLAGRGVETLTESAKQVGGTAEKTAAGALRRLEGLFDKK